MDEFLKPFENMQELFCFIYMITKTEYQYDSNLIRITYNSMFNKKMTNESIDLAIEKFFPRLMNSSLSDLKSILTKIDYKIRNKIECIEPPIDQCIECHGRLLCHSSRIITHYTIRGPRMSRFCSRHCQNCEIAYNIDTLAKNNQSQYYSTETDHFVLSNETVVESLLLRNLDAHIARNGVSFEGKYKILLLA
jgi:hypothetical protein